MNAKEFIQKFGWNDARVCILNCACPEDRWFMRRGDLVSDQDFDDLKRLVESHGLVKEHGSLGRAKEYADSAYTAPEVAVRLHAAIADVESCMEVSSESN